MIPMRIGSQPIELIVLEHMPHDFFIPVLNEYLPIAYTQIICSQRLVYDLKETIAGCPLIANAFFRVGGENYSEKKPIYVNYVTVPEKIITNLNRSLVNSNFADQKYGLFGEPIPR